MTPQDEVLAQVSAEMTRTFRAAAQIGRWLSDRRRDAQRQAEMASRAQADALRSVIEHERRLAEPVFRKAAEDTFWTKARPEEAAYVYAVASRFATIDPSAAMAARRCEQEARQRWHLDLAPGDSTRVLAEPVSSQDVRSDTLERVAPHLQGEGPRRWGSVLDQSAASDLQETAQAQSSGTGLAPGGSSVQQDRDEEMGRHEIGQVLDSHPQVARVVVRSVEALGADGQVHKVADFTAYDANDVTLDEASRALNDVVDRALRPEVFVARMAGRSFDRDDFEAETARPLMRAAGAAAGGAGVTRWDSQEAREEWARQRRADGIEPTAVRAARTGDMALARPATEATDPTRRRTGAGRRPSPDTAHGLRRSMGM